MNASSKTFCPLPWTHLHLHTDGGILPCCTSRFVVGNANDGPTQLAWNSEKMKQIRFELMNNIEPKNCSYCFDKEKLGKNSYRLSVLASLRAPAGGSTAPTRRERLRSAPLALRPVSPE